MTRLFDRFCPVVIADAVLVTPTAIASASPGEVCRLGHGGFEHADRQGLVTRRGMGGGAGGGGVADVDQVAGAVVIGDAGGRLCDSAPAKPAARKPAATAMRIMPSKHARVVLEPSGVGPHSICRW